MPGRYFEDYAVGQKFGSGTATMTAERIKSFAREFDPQPFHTDEEAARHTFFGGLVASGWHTASMAMRIMCDEYLLRSSSLGSPGIDSLQWLLPVRPGDTLRVRLTVLEARPLKSRPGVGLVKSRHEVLNQHDQVVMRMEGYGMFGQRPA
jgi:acyl dehydratase